MKAAELRSKTDEELRQELERLAREGFQLRMTQASSQEKRTHSAGAMRRDTARIKTVLRERQIAAEEKKGKETENETRS